MKQAQLLTDYIKVYRKLFDNTFCEELLKSTKDDPNIWKKHGWTHYEKETDNLVGSHHGDDLDVAYEIPEIYENYLNVVLETANNLYQGEVGLNSILAQRFSKVRINRYNQHTRMAKHHDNIMSLFETGSGSPVLSFVGALNNDFSGGEFIMFDNLHIHLNAGDIMVFPSAFMYKHEVKPVISGERWSFVSWGC